MCSGDDERDVVDVAVAEATCLLGLVVVIIEIACE